MRRSASIALACAAGAAAILPAAAPASAATTDLGLVVPVLAPMLPGQTGWVSTMWLAEGVGMVQALNSYAHQYQLVDAQLK